MVDQSDHTVDISRYLQNESHVSRVDSQKYTGEFIIKAKPVNQKIYRKNFKRYLDIDIKNRKLYERLKYIQSGKNKSEFKDINKHQKKYDKFASKLYNLPPIRPHPTLYQKQIERQNEQLVQRIIQMKSQVKKENQLEQQHQLAKKNHQSENDILATNNKSKPQYQQKQQQQPTDDYYEDDFEEETEEVKMTRPKSENQLDTKIKGILFINVVGLNQIDKVYQEFLYHMNAKIYMNNHFKKIETNLNQIYSDCQILWNKKDHFKLNIDLENLKEQELMVELNLEAKEQIGNLKIELAQCIANPGSWINRNFLINSDDGN